MGHVGRVVFLRWITTFEVGDLDAVMHTLRAIRRERGTPLAEVEIVPAGIANPSPMAVLDAIRAVRSLGHMREMHCVVIEGDSMQRKLVRGMFNAISFAIGEDAVYCASLEDAVERACARTGQDARATLEAAYAQGLLVRA